MNKVAKTGIYVRATMMTGTPLMDTAEAAAHLGVSPRTLYKWAEHGQVPFVRIGRLLRFRGRELDEWLEARANRITPAGATDAVTK